MYERLTAGSGADAPWMALGILHEAIFAFSSQKDLHSFWESVCKSSRWIIPAKRIGILLREEEEPLFEVVARMERGAFLPGLIGQLDEPGGDQLSVFFEIKKTQWIEATSSQPKPGMHPFHHWLMKDSPRGVLAVPIFSGNERIGAAIFVLHPLSGEDLHTILGLATVYALHVGITYNLIKTQEELARAHQIKNDFISNVSHELRTPLTALKGSVDLIRTGVAGPLTDKMSDMLNIAARNSDRLLRLINEILDADKIAKGKLELSLKPNPIGKVIQLAIKLNRTYAEQYQVKLVGDCPEEDPLVLIDRGRIVQVLTNLVSNAVKFSPTHQSVALGYQTDDQAQEVKIFVRDKGPGIPEEFQKKIFEKFSQAENTKKGGTGLGLNIAKAITVMHGGSIWYETGRGGTTFFFTLPIFEVDKANAANSPANAR